MGNISSLNEESFHTHYTLGKQLGKGAQGRVHVCHHKVNGTSYAVKMIDRNVKTSWTTYRREVELCRSACSNNVVKVLADFADDEYCYIIMERFEGHLRKGLKWVAKEEASGAGCLGDVALRCIVGQVLEGIRHLHKCGIMHRDVKSHNVFVDRLDVRSPQSRVVLGDLGLARRLEQGRYLCAQVGTRKYWAPELYDKKYSHNVDIFALGVLFFLIVCSKYPYLDEQQTRHRDVFGEGLVPANLSPQALSFLEVMLQKDPSQRPFADEMAQHHWLVGGGSSGGGSDRRERRRPRAGAEDDACPPPPDFTQKPLPPQVCQHWQSCQVPKVRGDANEQLEEDSVSHKRGPCAEESDEDTQTLRSEKRLPAQAGAGGDKTPSTPTTTFDMSSIATASPSTKSASPGERRAGSPSRDQLDQDTVEEAHSSESATARFWDQAGICTPRRDAATEQARTSRLGRRDPAYVPEIESL